MRRWTGQGWVSVQLMWSQKETTSQSTAEACCCWRGTGKERDADLQQGHTRGPELDLPHFAPNAPPWATTAPAHT